MKNFINYSLLCILMIVFTACQDTEDLLDKAETGDITADKIYNDIVLADQVLNDLYGRLPNILSDQNNKIGRFNADALLDCGTVYGQAQMNWSSALKFTTGDWGPIENPLEWENGHNNAQIYRRNYEAVRACLNFLSRIEEVPFDEEYGYGVEEMEIKIGEAKFLLAFYYAELVRFYGGVPLIKAVLELGDPEIKKPRNTFDECIAYIVQLCDEAAAALPLEHADNQYGRATKGAALALKSRMLLTAASPLFNNPEAPADSPFRGRYDPGKWETAALAAADVIQLNQYNLVDDISSMFNTITNEEVIFARQQRKGNKFSGQSLPPGIGRNGGNVGRNQGTFNMMKLYKVLKDGKAYDMTDPASGWSLEDPYKNIDPRFYRDFTFNTARTGGKDVKMWALGEGAKPSDKAPHLVPSNNWSYLIMIKFADEKINVNWQETYHNYQFLRYAEVLLNYAEAANEVGGPETSLGGAGLTARQAVNLIRRRTTYPAEVEYLGQTGGMPDIPAGLTQEQFRKEIRQERMVELNFEEAQFFDLRRWMMDPETQHHPQFLIPYLTIKDGVKSVDYRIENQADRPFTTAWYLMPIPDEQIKKNPALVQNPGWSGSPEAENG